MADERRITKWCQALLRAAAEGIEASGYDVLESRVSLSKAEKIRITAQTWLGSMLPLSPPLR